jgi:hypothetical protein
MSKIVGSSAAIREILISPGNRAAISRRLENRDDPIDDTREYPLARVKGVYEAYMSTMLPTKRVRTK